MIDDNYSLKPQKDLKIHENQCIICVLVFQVKEDLLAEDMIIGTQ